MARDALIKLASNITAITIKPINVAVADIPSIIVSPFSEIAIGSSPLRLSISTKNTIHKINEPILNISTAVKVNNSIGNLSFIWAVVSAMSCAYIRVYHSLIGKLSDEIEGSKTIGSC